MLDQSRSTTLHDRSAEVSLALAQLASVQTRGSRPLECRRAAHRSQSRPSPALQYSLSSSAVRLRRVCVVFPVYAVAVSAMSSTSSAADILRSRPAGVKRVANRFTYCVSFVLGLRNLASIVGNSLPFRRRVPHGHVACSAGNASRLSGRRSALRSLVGNRNLAIRIVAFFVFLARARIVLDVDACPYVVGSDNGLKCLHKPRTEFLRQGSIARD